MKSLYNCKTCGRPVYNKFGSGQFCSRSCANTRRHSDLTKQKIRKGVCEHFGYNPSVSCVHDDVSCNVFECEFCGKRCLSYSGLCVHIRAKHSDENLEDYNKVKMEVSRGNKVKINITKHELDVYRSTHDRCEICGKSISEMSNSYNKKLSVDHNHSTNEFRGLLCPSCNSCLGWFEKNEDAVLNYLETRGREFPKNST